VCYSSGLLASLITSLKAQISAKLAELLQLKTELEQSIKAGKEKDPEPMNKATELSNLKTRLSEQAQAIKNKDTELPDLKKQIFQNGVELSRHVNTIAELEKYPR
jgi:chromosome segregation ATPase